MQQVQTNSISNQYTCRYLGDERQKIIGFCLLYECQDPYDFCLRCNLKKVCHEGHSDTYLFGFKDLLENLDKGIKKLQLEYFVLQELYQWINHGQNYIEKQQLKNSEKNIQKLQKIKKNIELILKLIFQLKSLFIQSKESLQQKNYHFFTNNIKQLKKGLLAHLNLKIIETITSIKQKQMKPFQNLKNASLRNQNEKLTQIYFLKIIDSCNSLGSKKFSSFLRIDVQIETKLYFDQFLIRNPQFTLASIWKTLRELEKLQNTSKFDDENNRVQSYQLRQQNLRNENFKIICQTQEAIDILNQLILLKPNNELFSLIIGYFLEVNSNYENSIKCIEEVIRLNPQNANLYNQKGIFLYQFGQFLSSSKSFEQAIKLSPNNPTYYINKGISLIQLGDYDDSIIHFNQAKIFEAINLSVINQYTQRINRQIRNDNTIYQFPIKLDNQNLLKQDDAENYLKQGNDLSNQGDYLNAILCYDVTISLKPDYAKAYNDKGYSLHQLQKYEKAIQCYEKAIKLKENNAQYYNNNGIQLVINLPGNSLKRLSKYQDALQYYNEAIRLDPDCADFYNNKGLCLHNMQKYKDANECYDKAIRLNPEFANYYNNKGTQLVILFGFALFKFKHYEAAIECFNKAISLQPDFADFYNSKGIQLVIYYLLWLYPSRNIMKKLSDSLIKQSFQKQNLKIINRQVINLQIRRNFVQSDNIVPFLLQQRFFYFYYAANSLFNLTMMKEALVCFRAYFENVNGFEKSTKYFKLIAII